MVTLLSLPPEILEVIFDYAAFDPTKPVRHSSPGTFCIPRRLPSATSIVLVCRKFAILAQAIVWRHVTINHTRPAAMTTLLLLLESLQREQPRVLGQSGVMPAPVSCVQSLYLSHFNRLKDTINLAALIRRCHQLKNLTLVDSNFCMSPAMQQTFEERGPSLQRFYVLIDPHFERRTLRSQPQGLEVALCNMPNLQSLVIQLTSHLDMCIEPVPWTSLRHLHVSSLAMSESFIAKCFSKNEQLDEIAYDGLAARHWQSDSRHPTPQDPSAVRALHFLDRPREDSILESSLMAFTQVQSLTLEGPVPVEWLAKVTLPDTLKQLSLVNLQVSPLPVLEHIITNPKAIPSVDFLRCTFETGSAFYTASKGIWELPLPRNFFLPAFEELESSATLEDGFSGGTLTISHQALQTYARNRGRERPAKVLLVEEFGFEPAIP